MSHLTQQVVACQLRKDEKFRAAHVEELAALFAVPVETVELPFGSCGFLFSLRTTEDKQNTGELTAVDIDSLVHLIEWLWWPRFSPVIRRLQASLPAQQVMADLLRQKLSMLSITSCEVLLARIGVQLETVELPPYTYRLVAEMDLMPDKTTAPITRRL